jgi:hypothetical protein
MTTSKTDMAPEKNKDSGFNLVASVMFGLFFLFGVLLLRSALIDVFRFRNADEWLQVQAAVVSTNIVKSTETSGQAAHYDALDRRWRQSGEQFAGEEHTDVFSIDVHYQYRVDGKTFFGAVDEGRFLNRSGAESLASSKFARGKNLTVSYDPAAPDVHEPSENPQTRSTDSLFPGLIGLAFMSPLLFMLRRPLMRRLSSVCRLFKTHEKTRPSK